MSKKITGAKVSHKSLRVVSARIASEIVRGPQGQRFVIGVNNDLCGSLNIAGGLVAMRAGMIAKPHVHHYSESVIFIIEGWAATLTGPELEPTFHGPGDFLFIPDGLEHAAVNLSDTERVIAIEFRTEKVFNDDVELLPELAEKAERIAQSLRARFATGDLPLPEDWQSARAKPFTFPDPEESAAAATATV